ncbi:MAG TPA: polysaccharide deacetylase family protein [Symbiobacteriaceae bacterium]|nr:polysaccharide deacetylase family protein [Symbiobacteriaceae bacterium]
MRRIVGTALRTSLRALASLRSYLPAPSGARIITYHSVRPVGSGARSSYVHPDDFAAQMRWLVQAGYQVVPLTALAECLQRGDRLPDNWVCITFDDGYADNYIHAFPVLRQYKLPATIFLVSGKINRDPLFLTFDQMAEMSHHGIDFGAHTVDHVSLSSLPAAEAERQVRESLQQVEVMQGATPRHFCYPFGHYNETVEGFVRSAGFLSCCTEQAGTVQSGSNPLRLRRAGILGTDTLRDFQLKVGGAYDWWINLYMQIEEQRRRKRGGMPA